MTMMLNLFDKDLKILVFNKNASTSNYKFSWKKWKNRKSQQKIEIINTKDSHMEIIELKNIMNIKKKNLTW